MVIVTTVWFIHGGTATPTLLHSTFISVLRVTVVRYAYLYMKSDVLLLHGGLHRSNLLYIVRTVHLLKLHKIGPSTADRTNSLDAPLKKWRPGSTLGARIVPNLWLTPQVIVAMTIVVGEQIFVSYFTLSWQGVARALVEMVSSRTNAVWLFTSQFVFGDIICSHSLSISMPCCYSTSRSNTTLTTVQ